MKAKILMIAFLLLVVLGVGGGGAYVFYKSKAVVVEESSQVQPTVVPNEELATWTDPAEFSFRYPKSLQLNPHDEDQENYAHVELTSTTSSGSLIVWVKDTTAYDIETWVKQSKLQGAIDSTLGGEKAKKILTTDGAQKLLVVTVRDGYLYQIEVDGKDSSFWNKVYETVSSSFKFGEKTATEETTNQSLEEELGFEEEVIE